MNPQYKSNWQNLSVIQKQENIALINCHEKIFYVYIIEKVSRYTYAHTKKTCFPLWNWLNTIFKIEFACLNSFVVLLFQQILLNVAKKKKYLGFASIWFLHARSRLEITRNEMKNLLI